MPPRDVQSCGGTLDEGASSTPRNYHPENGKNSKNLAIFW